MSGCHNPNEKDSKCRCMACRVEKLESHLFSHQALRGILDRIEKLEEDLKSVSGRQDFLHALINASICVNKKPHKCPVCDGLRTNNKNVAIGQSVTTIIMVDCHACAGKGIVWG